MAHKKGGSTTKKNRDSISKRLGVKVYGGGKVLSGNIIIRQKGSKYHSGDGTKLGRDFTIFALKNGTVHFKRKLDRNIVEVIGLAA